MSAISLILTLNIFAAGWLGLVSVLFTTYSLVSVYKNRLASKKSVRLSGLAWCLLAVLSVAGVWSPMKFIPMLWIQLLLQSIYTFFLISPAFKKRTRPPWGLFLFFLLWTLLLAVALPWPEFI
jgi:hypothetical protein